MTNHFTVIALAGVLLAVGGASASSCPFASTQPCNACVADESNCANIVADYCESINWNDAGCYAATVECPFTSNPGSNPCVNAACSDPDANEAACVSSIINHCTTYPTDPGCAGFGYAKTQILEAETTFSGNTAQVTPIPAYSGDISISGCMRQTKDNDGYIFSNTANSALDQRCYALYSTGNALYLYTTAGSIFSDTTGWRFDDGNYHSFAVTADGTNVVFYVDGQQLGAAKPQPGPIALCNGASAGAQLGARHPGANSPYRGKLQKVWLYDYALSPSEAAAITCPVDASVQVLSQEVAFTGSNTHVYTGTIPNYRGTFSFTSCVKQTNGVNAYIVANSFASNTDQRCFSLNGLGNYLELYYGGPDNNYGSFSDLSFNYRDGVYHLISVVISGSTLKFYVDNELYSTKTLAGEVRLCSGGHLQFGNRQPTSRGGSFVGSIANSAFHNSALTVAELTALAAQCPTTSLPTQFTPLSTATLFTGGKVNVNTMLAYKDSVTISGCIKQYPGNDGYIFANSALDTSSYARCFSLYSTGNAMSLYYGYPSSKVAASPAGAAFDDGKFYHPFAVVASSTQVKFYVDNVLYGTVPVTAKMRLCAGGFAQLGSRQLNTQFPFYGSLTNVNVHNSLLTAAQISAISCPSFVAESTTLLSTQTSFSGSTRLAVPVPAYSTTFTFSTCMRQSAGNQGYVFDNAAAPNTAFSRCFSLLSLGNALRVYYGFPNVDSILSVQSSATTLNNNAWHSVAVVVDGRTIRFYVDGAQVGTDGTLGAGATLCYQELGAAQLGDRFPNTSWNGPLNGALANTKLHNTALSLAQVQALGSCP